jgi:hypothetical protein
MPKESPSVMVGDIEFKVLSADQPVSIKDSAANNARQSEVVCPSADKPISFSITNTSKDKDLGVDVKLNGYSLFLEQTQPPQDCRVWVLKPGKTYTLKGFYSDSEKEKNVTPFKVLVGEEARKTRSELGDKAGQIQISVFEQVKKDDKKGEKGEEMAISRSLRGIEASKEKKVRQNLPALQNYLLQKSLLKRQVEEVKEDGKIVKRELIVKDNEAETKLIANLQAVEFPRTAEPTASLLLQILPKPAGE